MRPREAGLSSVYEQARLMVNSRTTQAPRALPVPLLALAITAKMLGGAA
jgi:hypothetical protein